MSPWEIGGRKKSQESRKTVVEEVNEKIDHCNVVEARKEENFLKKFPNAAYAPNAA